MDNAAEPIKSLADELIADLDDLGDDSEGEDGLGDAGEPNEGRAEEGEGKGKEKNDSNPLPVDASTIHSDDIEVIAPLFFSEKFQKHMQVGAICSLSIPEGLVPTVERSLQLVVSCYSSIVHPRCVNPCH
eukprot:TRINITY_DN429_c1_g1_i1.p1 TRINITY_DN429_c1_g1~~TRINITY_DN429_c1_g1_i1.p1  ORF type:complete len:130 (+),score=15.58 TRINITY_DN429_c1_g1_i1:67-456(+)